MHFTRWEGGRPLEQAGYEERGYLNEDFRLFHLRGAMAEPVDWHYHTFHKIILFLSGRAGYGIEGKSYALESGDLVLVPSGCIHRPEVAQDAPYERVIVYISPDFLRSQSTPEHELESCFARARAGFRFVLRPGAERRLLTATLASLEREQAATSFGAPLLAQALFFQFFIGVSRGMAEQRLAYVPSTVRDEKIAALLEYLSAHLTEELRIDDLAAQFYISKYHMMRRFKEETGYTIHNYVVTKRLMLAREKIADGMAVSEACYACGFGEYSAFARAYKKLFAVSPRTAK